MTKRVIVAAVFSMLLLGGCGENKSEAKVVSEEPAKPAATISTATKSESTPKAEPKKVVTKKSTEAVKQPTKTVAPEVSKFYTIFKDGAKIAPESKEMLIMFGQASDPYTKKIKDDIVNDEALAAKIKSTVTPIYIDARDQKVHKFLHNAQMMDVDTRTLVSIYNVTSTPTLIFADKEASHIFVVPGYMPPAQFKATLDFISKGAWQNKDRKNGEIYQALREFYEQNGIKVKPASKPEADTNPEAGK